MARKPLAQALLTRDSIIDVAEELFAAQGLSRTTLQDIASAAGVTRGAIYWHFKGKSELFDAMMERAFLRFEVALELRPSHPNQPPLETLRQHALHLLEYLAVDARLRRLLEIATQKIEYVDELLAVRERIVRARTRHIGDIERCLDLTASPQADKPVLAIGLHAIVDGLIQNWMLDPSAFDLIKVGQLTVDTFLRGLNGYPTPTDACGHMHVTNSPASPC
jgi:TetR/AcrR family acrAB operon transcriptional repressor